MLAAELLLLEVFLWEYIDRRRSREYIAQYKPFPLPPEDERFFDPSSVSVIVPTIDWDPASFTKSLCSWLANEPGEVIIVTTDAEIRAAHALVNSPAVQAALTTAATTSIKVRGVAEANKRDQLIEGINESCGPIIALVDDDAIWEPTTLLYLLAPFEDVGVGLVGGPIESYLPDDRKHPDVITAWETAALRNRSRRRGGNKAFYVADGSTNFTLSGATMFVRASIVRDEGFQTQFANETFLGVRQNSGDDSFITRWVLFQHLRAERPQSQNQKRQQHQGVRKQWKLGMQLVPEAQVSTTLMTDSRFAGQMKRWMRTGLRFRLTCLLSDPGFRGFRRTAPYMCRKMVESMYSPLLTLLWYLAFFLTLWKRPIVGSLVAGYYIYGIVSGLRAFVKEFPFCRRYVWAAFLADKVSLVSDWYCWATLPTERWYSRKTVDNTQQPPAPPPRMSLD